MHYFGGRSSVTLEFVHSPLQRFLFQIHCPQGIRVATQACDDRRGPLVKLGEQSGFKLLHPRSHAFFICGNLGGNTASLHARALKANAITDREFAGCGWKSDPQWAVGARVRVRDEASD